ncbi:response regulator [bacterium]|nr:response regulator [bacterium]
MLYNQFDKQASSLPAAGRGVLLVDDSKLFQRVLQRVVETEGGKVVGVAESGAFGADMAITLKPDLVILDHNMPDMNGVQCLRAMRESGVDCKVIVCSGELTLECSQEYARLRADAIFVKPLAMAAFTKALRVCLGLESASAA